MIFQLVTNQNLKIVQAQFDGCVFMRKFSKKMKDEIFTSESGNLVLFLKNVTDHVTSFRSIIKISFII